MFEVKSYTRTDEDNLRVTLIGTLPPLKGVSPYCLALATALEEEVDLEFVGFLKLYPDFLYPGGSQSEKSSSFDGVLKGSRVRRILTYYNPLTWVWAGLTLRGHVVHLQWWSYVLAIPALVILLLSKLRNRRVVITAHNVLPHEVNRLTAFLNRVVLMFGDHIIVHNERNRAVLSELLNISPEDVSIIPHGVLQPAPVEGLTKTEARALLGIPTDARVVLFFGNIREYKGLDDLIAAMALVVKRDPRAYLVVAGQPWGPSDPYHQAVEMNGLTEHSLLNLEFVPADRVEAYFVSADVLALPYRYFDSQSGVAALALFFGVPMVVTRVGGLPEVCGDSSVVVPPEDALALSEALSEILQNDELRSTLAAKTVEKAASYQWTDIAKSTIKCYRKVLSAQPE